MVFTQVMCNGIEGNVPQPHGKGCPPDIEVPQSLVGCQQCVLYNLLRFFPNRNHTPYEVQQWAGMSFHQEGEIILMTFQYPPNEYLIASVFLCLHI